jgi:hypothetical protein
MNNLLDYSHMIKTYVMRKDYDAEIKSEGNYLDYPYSLLMHIECKCDQFLFCYNSFDINKCKYNELIINNLPLFKIILNKNIKKQFKLPNEWNNYNLNSSDFFKIVFYIVSFTDESIDYSMNKPHIKCIVSLSLYILIINNYDTVKKILYLLEPLLNNLKNKLNTYLSDENSINKLKELFDRYYLDSPDECINIMHQWVKMFDELL